MLIFLIISKYCLSTSWLSDGKFCRVVDDRENFVECACSHLSVYAIYADQAALDSYNAAFYASGFICISGEPLCCLYFISSHLHVAKSDFMTPGPVNGI